MATTRYTEFITPIRYTNVYQTSEVVEYRVELDPEMLHRMARKAAENKGGKSIAGAVKVTIISRHAASAKGVNDFIQRRNAMEDSEPNS